MKLKRPEARFQSVLHEYPLEGVLVTEIQKSLGLDTTFCSSSVTSKPSSTRGTKCYVCGEGEVKIAKPFVRCSRCKRAWHQFCHNPKIKEDTHKFTCNRCTKAKSATSTPSSDPIAKSPLGKMDDRQKKKIAIKTASTPKPGKKSTAYPTDTENKKRKRSHPKPRAFNPGDHQISSPELNVQLGGSVAEACGTASDQTAIRPALSQEREGVNPLVSTTIPTRPRNENASAPSLVSHNPKVTKLSNGDLVATKKSALPPDLLRLMNPERVIESPEDEPPPPNPTSGVMTPWLLENHTNNVKAKFANNLPATIRSATITDQYNAKHRAYHSPYATEYTEAAPPLPQVQLHEDAPIVDTTEEQHEEGNIPDIPPLPLNDSPIGQEAPTRHVNDSNSIPQAAMRIASASNSPVLGPSSNAATAPNPSPSTSPTIYVEEVVTLPALDISPDNGFHVPAPHPMSLEAKRRDRALNFDSSGLDSWLAKQRESKPDYPRSTKELLETQTWGNIDPRVAWSVERSPEWFAAKRAEIEARPKRKANFGKLLTEQIKAERRAKGWSIHQEKEIADDNQSIEMNKRLEELTGIKVNGANLS